MDLPDVITDEFGVQTVVLNLKHLQDFPEFIKYVVDNKIAENQGIFKIRLRENVSEEHVQCVLEELKKALNRIQNNKRDPKYCPHDFYIQKQHFHPMSEEDNIFLYRLQKPSQDDKKNFYDQFKDLTLCTEYSTCCTDKLQSCREQLLNHYWSVLRSDDAAVMYGAGLTIKPKNSADALKVAEGFSLSHLNTCLKFMKKFVSGISWPHFFLGLMHASFAWHIEDSALWSILYLYFGAPKVWFGVPPSYYGAVIQVMCRLGFPEAYKQCTDMLNHKCFVVDPFILIKFGIPVFMIIQQAGEFVVTRPYAAHSGFNCGVNVGEAANFGSPDWVPLGMIAASCKFYKTTAKLDLTDIIKNCRPELLECYKQGKYYKAFPVPSDPFSCGISSIPASSLGILGISAEPLELVCKAEKEYVQDSGEEEYIFVDSGEEHDFVDDSVHQSASLLECPDCPKTYAGGTAKVQRLIDHTVKFHLQRNSDIVKIVKKKYLSYERKFKTKRGQACSRFGKFIRGSSTHLKVHMRCCKGSRR